MTHKVTSRTIRRSVALPRQVVDEAIALAPPELRKNLNRLVIVALQEFARRQRSRAFEEAMARMAADPAIQRECAVLNTGLAAADADGLDGD